MGAAPSQLPLGPLPALSTAGAVAAHAVGTPSSLNARQPVGPSVGSLTPPTPALDETAGGTELCFWAQLPCPLPCRSLPVLPAPAPLPVLLAVASSLCPLLLAGDSTLGTRAGRWCLWRGGALVLLLRPVVLGQCHPELRWRATVRCWPSSASSSSFLPGDDGSGWGCASCLWILLWVLSRWSSLTAGGPCLPSGASTCPPRSTRSWPPQRVSFIGCHLARALDHLRTPHVLFVYIGTVASFGYRLSPHVDQSGP